MIEPSNRSLWPPTYFVIACIVTSTPWANASDSRLKPAAFQGADVAYALSKQWSLEAMDMTRFESRTNSAFDNKTLLTSFVAGSPGLPGNTYFAGGNGASNAGFTYGRLGFGDGRLASNLHFYHFADIASKVRVE